MCKTKLLDEKAGNSLPDFFAKRPVILHNHQKYGNVIAIFSDSLFWG
jgi:hypothetical protein